MEAPNRKIAQLYEDGLAYEAAGDSYMAVKLFRKIIRLDKNWSPAYARLGLIYKGRAEWKPALHYSKKALAQDPSLADVWWALGISATALKKYGIAKSVWSKFGYDNFAVTGPICIRLKYEKQLEIVWVKPIDPARGYIINIPHPGSDRRYRDLVLFDREIVGHNVVGRRRVPIYEELSLYKRSGFQTFSCTISIRQEADLQSLEKLCVEHRIGFEIWSNTIRQMAPASADQSPEYYSRDALPGVEPDSCVVAFGACELVDVQTVLESWRVVTCQTYSDLRRH